MFGFIITLMGCYNGFNSKGGAQGVGAATTNAVVSASILILVSDYVMTGSFSPENDMNDAPRPRSQLPGVKKSFGDKHVLRGLDLTVGKAESVVMIGGSGTGKSVTLKCILGILGPMRARSRSTARKSRGFRGRARDAHLAKFGMLFQGSALFD